MTHKATFFNCGRWGDEAKSYLSESEKLKAAGVEAVFAEDVLSKDKIPAGDAASFDIAGVFMDSPVDAAVIAALPNLKLIATLSTGYDHIDLAAAAARGIPVSSVPAYGENTVAEFAFALILALSRKVREASARVRESISSPRTACAVLISPAKRSASSAPAASASTRCTWRRASA